MINKGDGKMIKHWKTGELGTHSYASNPHYNIAINGKVEINPDSGKADNKVELRVNGMYRMVSDWLDSGHQLSKEQRKVLIDKLAIRGNEKYNSITKEWQGTTPQ